MNDNTTYRTDRRAFLRDGSLILLGAGLTMPAADRLFADDGDAARAVRVGLVTDLHYADKPPAGTRYYRETLAKFAEAAERFTGDEPDFVVELGDFIDAADTVDEEKKYLQRIQREFSMLPGEHHYVLGNHCVYTLTKDEFLEGVEKEKSFYSFDAGGVHFVVLDSCFRSDGEPYGRKNFEWTDPNIPAEQVEWLTADLAAASSPTIVFAHQRLDVSNHYGVKNAGQVRTVLEDSERVLAVFQGHSHRNDYNEIAGIHYCTLVAMVEGSGAESNGYASMDVFRDGMIRITGHRRQSNYEWS